MSARSLLEVALRVIGLWFFFYAVPATAIVVSAAMGVSQFHRDQLWMTILNVGAQMLVGAGLALWAPGLAAWFYPADRDGGEVRLAVGPGDVYRTACLVLGVYLLVAATRPAAWLLSAGLANDLGSRTAAEAAVVIVHVFSGMLLIFGSRPIAEVVANLRYDPDTVPKQQLSLGLLLVLIILFAVILGVVRMFTVTP